MLCICSCDDPVLPPASTVPFPLFQRNPYFLLVLTDRGGHCGFTLESATEIQGGKEWTGNQVVQEANWSHITVLEYFKVVADFLEGEDGAGPGGPRNRGSNMVPPRQRASIRRPQRPQSQVKAEEGSFTWRRSYTR